MITVLPNTRQQWTKTTPINTKQIHICSTVKVVSWLSDFQDLSRCHHRKIFETLGEANCFGPREIQKYSSIFNSLVKHIFDLIGFAYVLRVLGFSFFIFQFMICDISKIPPLYFPFLLFITSYTIHFMMFVERRLLTSYTGLI